MMRILPSVEFFCPKPYTPGKGERLGLGLHEPGPGRLTRALGFTRVAELV